MRVAALIIWAGTASAGLYLLVSWLVHDGIRQPRTKVTRYPLVIVATHPVLALAGLALWIAYLAEGKIGYAWAAFGVLCGSAALGIALLTRWLTGIGGRHAADAGSTSGSWVAVLHGLAGLSTFVLVLVTVSAMSHG